MNESKSRAQLARNIIGVLCICAVVVFLLPFVVFQVFNIGNLVGAVIFSVLAILCFAYPKLRDPYCNWRKGKAGKVLHPLLFALVVIGTASTLVISAGMIVSCHTEPTEEATVIVLGGQVIGTQPSLMLQERLEVALQYLEEHPDVPCIVTGGQGSDEQISEALCMQQWLVRHGISEERIFLEAEAVNTAENLQKSARIIEEKGFNKEVAIVTHDFHEFRAFIIAREVGLKPGAVPTANLWFLFPGFYVRELFAVLGHFIR